MTSTCMAPDCERPVRVKGKCTMHYQRFQKYGSFENPERRRHPCGVLSCEEMLTKPGLCARHYRAFKINTALPAVELRPGTVLPTQDTCSVPECGRPRIAGTLCGMHYRRNRIYGEVGAPYSKKGRGTIDENGYRRIGGKREHRIVMEQKLGRKLLPGENVHHINGVRNDNRPENLELWVTMQPTGQRVEDLLAWAREIIHRYG